MQEGERLFYGATARNREPILEVLQRVLPAHCTVVEVGSGSGEHAVWLTPRLGGRAWLPSDPDATCRASVSAWTRYAFCAGVLPPLALDVLDPRWSAAALAAVEAAWPPVPPVGAVFSANMIHIAPWEATLGLLAGASRLLAGGGRLVLYGPFRRGGSHTAPSNAEFDQSLRSRDPRWGVRELDDVVAGAAALGLGLLDVVAMPANNLTVVLEASEARRDSGGVAGNTFSDSVE